jgi:hypothetical protein
MKHTIKKKMQIISRGFNDETHNQGKWQISRSLGNETH